jgi:hypothetical protein
MATTHSTTPLPYPHLRLTHDPTGHTAYYPATPEGYSIARIDLSLANLLIHTSALTFHLTEDSTPLTYPFDPDQLPSE